MERRKSTGYSKGICQPCGVAVLYAAIAPDDSCHSSGIGINLFLGGTDGHQGKAVRQKRVSGYFSG